MTSNDINLNCFRDVICLRYDAQWHKKSTIRKKIFFKYLVQISSALAFANEGLFLLLTEENATSRSSGY
jgi:hypothetical protein